MTSTQIIDKLAQIGVTDPKEQARHIAYIEHLVAEGEPGDVDIYFESIIPPAKRAEILARVKAKESK